MKKFLILLVLFAFLASPVLAQEEADSSEAGVLPGSFWYGFDKLGESLGGLFAWTKEAKAKRNIKLAKERLAESEKLQEQGKDEKAGLALGQYSRKMHLAKQYAEGIKDIDKKNNVMFQYDEVVIDKQDPWNEQEREREQKEKPVNGVNQPGNNQTQAMKAKNIGITNGQTEAMASPQNLGSSGKEAGEVAQPKDSCDEKYECKITCGTDMINNCNDTANGLFDFTTCLSGCYKYNILYGCGMEAGCDAPCYTGWEHDCSPSSYQNCLTKCDNLYKDCY